VPPFLNNLLKVDKNGPIRSLIKIAAPILTSQCEISKISPRMVWDKDKIRDLRLRMGWSQSDLARRLKIESAQIGQLEMDLEEAPEELSQALDILLKQADVSADAVFCGALSEIVFHEDKVLQVDTSFIRRKFLDQ